MKQQKINLELREDLCLKFYLNLHLNGEHFDKNSALFEIITYTVQKIKENKDKDLSYNNLKFSSKTLKYIFGQERLEEKKEEIIGHLKDLIQDDLLEPKGKSFFITEKGLVKFYNVEKTK